MVLDMKELSRLNRVVNDGVTNNSNIGMAPGGAMGCFSKGMLNVPDVYIVVS